MADTDRHNLWAPWRMEYILGEKGSSCVFCAPSPRHRRGGGPGPHRAEGAMGHAGDLMLVERADAFVCLNKYPFAAGHLLVVPKKHVSDLSELTDAEADELFRLVRASVERLKRALSPQGVNVGLNLGKAAGAGIAEHLHAHIVPRWDGDTNFMPVMTNVRVMPEYLEDTRKKLLPYFGDLA